jgi:hypothetical protein
MRIFRSSLILLALAATGFATRAQSQTPDTGLGDLIMGENRLIPNKVYSGHRSGKSVGPKRLCKKVSAYSLNYSAVFSNVDVDIPVDEHTHSRHFNVDFLLGPMSFTGKTSGVNPWTCEKSAYQADLETQSALLSFNVIPDPGHTKNARFELTQLKLGDLDIHSLKMRRFGIEIGFGTVSHFWDSTAEKYFNGFAKWILETSVKSFINDTITKQIAQLVQNIFGSQKQNPTLSIDNRVFDAELQKLDNILVVD